MGEELDKRIELLIEELSDLLQLKSKSGQKLDETNESNESKECPDFNGLQTTLESIGELLERDECDLYFECFYCLVLNVKRNLNLVFCINSGDPKRKISGLTSSNVELNSIWETICYKIDKLITNDMIKNNLDNELDFERVCSQLRFLYKLKDNESDKQFGEQGFDIWRLFDAIRVCKLESETIEYNERQLDWFLKRIILMINFELRLFKSGYFGTYCLTYKELVRPYLQSVRTRFETELSALNTDVSDLVSVLKNILDFEDNLQKIRQEFPRLTESPELDESFEWKSFIEINININSFNKTIYEEIICGLKKLNCFKTNNFEKCRPLKQSNIFSCVSKVFQLIENYEYLIVLDSFMRFLSYAISAHILDFFIHHFNNGKYDSIKQNYILLNSIHYIFNKLEKLDINVEKFRQMSEKVVKQLKADHVSILMIANNIEYSVLYLNRLWLELEIKLDNYRQRKSIFEFVLSETIHHFSGTKLDSKQIIFLLNNSIDLLLKNSYSRKDFLFENRNNIHNSCGILLIKLVLKITTNEEFLTNLKINNNLPENLDNNTTNEHWIQLIRPKLMENTFWLNTKFCVDKQFDVKHNKMIIRAFLSKNCSFSSYVLSNIDFDNENESLISLTADIFQLILLQNFRPNLLSEVMLKLIERHNSWPEFDKSVIFNSSPHIWWYSALESLITTDVNNYLLQNLKTHINDCLIGSQVTQEIEELYKSNDLLYRDNEMILEEGLQTIFTIINDLIETLPITLITSLESLNRLVPEYVNPLSKSITMNVLVSLLLNRLNRCEFFSDFNESKVILEFCQKLCQKLIESIESENHFLRFKKSIELKRLEKIDSLNNEEIEFQIIDSSIGQQNNKLNQLFERLHRLLINYKEVIDRNIGDKIDDSFEITLNKEKDLRFKLNRLPNEDYDYKQLLDSIDWNSFENQIKLKFDYFSRLSLFED